MVAFFTRSADVFLILDYLIWGELEHGIFDFGDDKRGTREDCFRFSW